MIANGLAAEGDYEIVLLSLVEQAKDTFFPVNKNIPRYVLGKKWIQPGIGYLPIIPKLHRFLKEQEVDIIVDVDIVLDSLVLPASRGTNTKVVSWEHFNLVYENASWYRRRILKYSVRRSDHVVTLTKKDKEAYAAQFNRSEHISTIYNPVEERIYREHVEREKWLITVGHLINIKGVDLLAEMARNVLADNPDWQWLIVGDGEERPFLKDFIRQHHLEGRLILTGRTDDVAAYLSRSQIYVMTSRLEGLGMCLIEAKEHSLPIISFDVPTGPSEIVRDSVDGYLVSPYDCNAMEQRISQLIQDETLRAEFSARARENLEEFRLPNVLQKWRAVLDPLAARP